VTNTLNISQVNTTTVNNFKAMFSTDSNYVYLYKNNSMVSVPINSVINNSSLVSNMNPVIIPLTTI